MRYLIVLFFLICYLDNQANLIFKGSRMHCKYSYSDYTFQTLYLENDSFKFVSRYDELGFEYNLTVEFSGNWDSSQNKICFKNIKEISRIGHFDRSARKLTHNDSIEFNKMIKNWEIRYCLRDSNSYCYFRKGDTLKLFNSGGSGTIKLILQRT